MRRCALRSPYSMVRRWTRAATASSSFFPRPAPGIEAARAIIEAVQPLGLTIRVGMHAGDCHVADGKCTGLAIHIGARVLGLAAPGEVLVSEAVQATAGAEIPLPRPGSAYVERGTGRVAPLRDHVLNWFAVSAGRRRQCPGARAGWLLVGEEAACPERDVDEARRGRGPRSAGRRRRRALARRWRRRRRPRRRSRVRSRSRRR